MKPLARARLAARRSLRSLRAWRRARGSRRGRSYAVTLVTPVRAGEAGALKTHLKTLETREESPLAGVPSVHFARWVVIEEIQTAPDASWPVPALACAYLLFTADITAPGYGDYSFPDSFLRELILRIPGDVDDIWRHCLDYPGSRSPDAAVRYLAESQLDAPLYYAAYPGVTPDEVREAVDDRAQLIRLATEHQGNDAELRAEFIAWPTST